jgi:hypothetical protein
MAGPELGTTGRACGVQLRHSPSIVEPANVASEEEPRSKWVWHSSESIASIPSAATRIPWACSGRTGRPAPTLVGASLASNCVVPQWQLTLDSLIETPSVSFGLCPTIQLTLPRPHLKCLLSQKAYLRPRPSVATG